MTLNTYAEQFDKALHSFLFFLAVYVELFLWMVGTPSLWK